VSFIQPTQSFFDKAVGFVMDPVEQHQPWKQALAWTTTIVLGVLSLGLVQLGCALYQAKRVTPLTQPNKTRLLIHNLFHSTHPEQPSPPPQPTEANPTNFHPQQQFPFSLRTPPPVASLPPLQGPIGEWTDLDSSRLAPIQTLLPHYTGSAPSSARALFHADEHYQSDPRIAIQKSDFIPDIYVQHLLHNKRDSAIQTKYLPHTAITNMEGVLHTFVSAQLVVRMTGDYVYQGYHSAAALVTQTGEPAYRTIVLSTTIHPDFEFPSDGGNPIAVEAYRLASTPIEGRDSLPDRIPTVEEKDDKAFRLSYDHEIKEFLVKKLTQDGRLPSADDANTAQQAMTLQGAIDRSEKLLNEHASASAICNSMKGMVLAIQDARGQKIFISGEMLFWTYVNQIHSEFAGLEASLPQGYVYVLDPPSIFAGGLRGSSESGTPPHGQIVMNRFQMLAFQYLMKSGMPCPHLHTLYFNDYLDPSTTTKGLALWRTTDLGERVQSKKSLSDASGHYVIPPGMVLVDHNNSDGFGNNIGTEGMTSKDGVLGCCSDASIELDPRRFGKERMPSLREPQPKPHQKQSRQ
jgi:hypothetical protein